ncbi:MAG: hypothetical protein Q4D42_07860 [Eubacteriales bacterium]|nr:hypothetical protein [Eubacteriales bacterium]
MATSTITDAKVSALQHPIAALDDRPQLSAADLKAYFDGDPQQLMQAHNALVEALLAPAAASSIGFSAGDGIAGNTLQAALEDVHEQLNEVALGTVPDASITEQKLSADIRQQLALLPAIQSAITQLQTAVQAIHPFGAQFPFMVLATSSQCAENAKDELATAALGLHYTAGVYNLGTQLSWLCLWKGQTTPSSTFCAKQNFAELLADRTTIDEIQNLPIVYSLICMSAEAYMSYRMAAEG